MAAVEAAFRPPRSPAGKLSGRCQPSGVKLVEGGQLLRHEPLFVRSEGPERRLQSLSQAACAIVVAHFIKNIGHCGIPLTLHILTATYARFRRATIRDNIGRV